MNFNPKEAIEDFDEFILIMDDQLDWLEAEAEAQGITIRPNIEYLSDLELLFDSMSQGESMDMISRLIVTFSRYLGEIVRNTYGGKWTLPLDDPNNVNFNMPVIIGHCSTKGLEFSPISVMRGYSNRRVKGMLKRAIDADIAPDPLDLSDLIETDQNPEN